MNWTSSYLAGRSPYVLKRAYQKVNGVDLEGKGVGGVGATISGVCSFLLG